MNKIEIYTNSTCGYCKTLKDELTKNNIEFEEKLTSKFQAEFQNIVNLTGVPTVPTIKYEDEFINNVTHQWFSKQARTLKSNDVDEIINSSENNMRLPLFLKKDDNEGSDLYFLGDLKVDKATLEETYIQDRKNNKQKPIVKMRMYLDRPIKEDLYKYISEK